MTQEQFDAAVGGGRWAELMSASFARGTDGSIVQRIAMASVASTLGIAARGVNFDTATAALAKMLAAGSDANIDIELAGKGTGGLVAKKLSYPLVQGRNYQTWLAASGYVAKCAADITSGTGPYCIAIAPSGLLYVCNNAAGTVSVLNPLTGALVATITVGTAPRGIVYVPSVDRMYVTNFTTGSISVIDPNLNTVVSTISSLTNPWGIAWSPQNDRLYVSSAAGGSTSLYCINPQTNALVTTITVGSFPIHVLYCPSNGQIYVANNNATTVSVVTPSSNTVATTITVGSSPAGLCYCPATDRIFCANNSSGTISVINPTTNTVAATIASVTSASVLAYSPTTGLLYCGTNAANGQLVVINPATNAVMTGSGYTLTGLAILWIAYHPHSGQMFVAESASKVGVVI